MAERKEHVHEKNEAEKAEDTLAVSTSTIEDAGAARKRIKVEIPAERIAGKIEEAMKELQHDAVLPGFRRGRAPKRLIEKRFGGELKNTVKGQLVAEAYQKAVEDHKLQVLGEPDVDLTKVELPATGPLQVALEVEITPEFELPSIEKLAVKKPKLEANDERINLAVENLRRHFGRWDAVNGGAELEDAVLADIKIQDPDNNVLTEQANVSVVVKAGSIAGIQFDDLGDKLKGTKATDVVTLKGEVPADSRSENLRGKTLTITLTAKEVKRLILPEVNADFVTMLGFESIDQLRSDLKDRLVVQLAQEVKNAQAQQIYRYLLSNTTLNLPPQLSQRQMANVFRRRALQLMQQGVPETDIVQHIDQLRVSSAQQSAVDLKLFFILGKLAEQFNIEVSEAEINGRIAEIANLYGRRPEKVRHELQQQGQFEQLFLQVRDGKVVDKLLETAEITEVDEKTLAEEFKNLPPLDGVGPNIQGVSTSTPPAAK